MIETDVRIGGGYYKPLTLEEILIKNLLTNVRRDFA